MTRLPGSVDELRGLRAARWIRESTPGQFDRYGPEAQLDLQNRAIARLGLVETDLAWRVAHSGRTVYRTPAMAAMLDAAAAGAFDVLLVGYVSRWQRNLRQTLNVLEDTLHPAGVAVWFADEEILSSCERDWDQLVAEATDAERYSRRLSRRIREGYASKLAKQRDPGGRAPYGFRRNPETKLLEVSSSDAHIVSTVFELAAARLTDREVAEQTGLSLYTVRGMLNNRLYAGRLPDGQLAHWAPIVSPALFAEVQAVRELRRTRDGRPANHRDYALSMLHCAACGRRLIGDTGRYRHVDACEAFASARLPRRRGRPARPIRGQHRSLPGFSYSQADYEGRIREVLERVSLGADLVAEVMTGRSTSSPDRLALARIERDRDAALARYRRTRDAGALASEMARLDELEAAAQGAGEPEALSPAEAVELLRNLPTLWDEAGPARRAIAESLFARIDVLGLARMHLEPTPAAIARGLAEAFSRSGAGYGRGERSRGPSNQLIVQGTIVTIGGLEGPFRAERSA